MTARPADGVAMCRAPAVRLAEPTGEAAKPNGGRWRLNAGSEMVTRVWGIAMVPGPWGPEPQAIRLVVDLGQAQFEKASVPALCDHWESLSYGVCGFWSAGTITPAAIEANLQLLEARTEAEAQAMPQAVMLKAMVDQQFPLEASIGATSADGIDGFELVRAGQTAAINGRSYSGDGELPLYVLRNARIYEASLVLYGADSDTGRIAASRHIHTDPGASMSARIFPALVAALCADLVAAHPGQEKAVLGAIAGIKADTDEAGVRSAVAAAVKDAQLSAAQARIVELEAQAAAKPAAQAAAATKPTKPAARAGEAESAPAALGADEDGDAPRSIVAAAAQLRAENPKLDQASAVRAAYRRWPALAAARPRTMGATAA